MALMTLHQYLAREERENSVPHELTTLLPPLLLFLHPLSSPPFWQHPLTLLAVWLLVRSVYSQDDPSHRAV